MSESRLSEGDRVSYGFTIEVMIDGDRAWPKFEINAAVRKGETEDEAIARIVGLVNDNYITNVTKTAEVVMAANKNQRG